MNKQIELSCGFGELRTIPNEFGEGKIWKSNKEIERREGVESRLPKIQEEGASDFGTVFAGNLGNGGDHGSIPEQQGPTMKRW